MEGDQLHHPPPEGMVKKVRKKTTGFSISKCLSLKPYLRNPTFIVLSENEKKSRPNQCYKKHLGEPTFQIKNTCFLRKRLKIVWVDLLGLILILNVE